MSLTDRTLAVVRRAPGLELVPLPGGGAEVTAGRRRRVRLTSDAAWLLGRLDGIRTVRQVAGELSERFAREVPAADALELLERTLVVNGLAVLAAPDSPGRSPAPRRARRIVLMRAEVMRPLAALLAPLAWPPLSLAVLAGSLVALALAAGRIAAAGAAAWSTPGAWLAAPVLALVSLLAHEAGHAAALSRAGGEPGAMTLVASRARLRFSTDLGGLDALPPLARAGVDVAGAAAQLCLLGGVAAAALAAGVPPPAPGLAVGAALALVALLPSPGSDGRWLLDDLARHDPADSIRRAVTPRRWLSCLATRLVTRAEIRRGKGPLLEVLPLMPVFVSASFPGWSPRRLRAHAARHIETQALVIADQRGLVHAPIPDEVRHVRPLRALRQAGAGAVVCGMHLGPFQYVPAALVRLGFPVAIYAASEQQRRFAEIWKQGAQRAGARFEVLSPRSVRDAIHALRLVRGGGMLYVLMDGQFSAARDQHRADFRFLGNDLYMRTGPAWLARKADAPLVLAATWYQGVARRVLEFSDPLPPPAGDDEGAIVARTAEMYAWFEPRVARDSAQWDGWVWPLAHWRATGGAPTATAAELEAARSRAARALAGEPRGARLVAEPTRVNSANWNGEHLIVDGPHRRVLVATPLARAVLDAAFAHERIARLPARTGASRDTLAPELARMLLAGLVSSPEISP